MFVAIFSKLSLQESLNEYSYDAELAGLRFGCSNTSHGITVRACVFAGVYLLVGVICVYLHHNMGA